MDQLGPRYDHKEIEDRIYASWEKSGYFNPDNLPVVKSQKSKVKSFTIIMPPPNANGSLHLGHAVFVTLEDILIRFWRMRGRRALWLPGADHAGFETQVVYDRKLDKEGRNRFTIPREELWKEIWDFTQENKKIMQNQLRRLGASCDWSREKFTLGPDIIQGVYGTFKKLYDDGLAYRDIRVINWCTKHRTALSDLEIKYVEKKDPLYFIKYGPLTVATVRPETKFGDTALAVNPKDKRYTKYIGKTIEVVDVLGPLKLKVIADEAVDPAFGTGVVKVTPAHDMTDFEICKRHKNEIGGPKIVIGEDGRLTATTGHYAGMKVAEARAKIAEEMEKISILEKVDPEYVHQVATCYKCGNILEPLPKMQWFIKMDSLAKKAEQVVKQKKIKFYPASATKIYFNWLKNIRDWNISRQIVWGIRIPAWYCLGCGNPKINAPVQSRWYIIRHGETDWNKDHRFQGRTDSPLNDAGIEQAKQAAEKLKGKRIDLVITSPLSRAKQTAEIIAKECGAKLVIENDIRERDFGEWEGLKHDEIKEKYSVESYNRRLDPSFEIPGGESWEKIITRVWNAFQKHHADYRHKNVVIVGHGGVARSLQHKIKNIPVMSSRIPANAEIWEIELGNTCEKCGGHFYEQDPDVFDTWFSSGEWPFLTLGFGKKLKPKTWDLKIYDGEQIFESLKNGTKRFETRAGKPEGADKDWREFKVGDVINFSLIEEKTEKKLSNETIAKEIVSIHHFSNLDKLLSAFNVKEIHPYRPEEYRLWWESRPSFKERIEKYGIWAFELKEVGKKNRDDFKTFYPTDVMETGHDILFFWVARMIMLGLYRTGKIPFKTVYLHGLVRDKDRQKMSKSKGNVMDPLGVAELYGTDALRIALIAGNTPGNDIIISEDKIRGYRNFATKIWNIARFIIMSRPSETRKKITLSKDDKINLKELAKIKNEITKHIEHFEFHLAAEKVYHYIWHTFADKIIESYKPRLRTEEGKALNDEGAAAAYQTLEEILLESLKMLHPFMPFMTEEIYGKLRPGKMLMIENW